VAELGQETVGALLMGDADGAAKALGRALHTVQDNCAHAGMGNPEHAWYSLSDVCQDTTLSPDLAPEARPCAQADTEVLMARFLETLVALDAPADLASTNSVKEKHVGYFDKCDYLAEADDWSGRDLTWKRDLVRGPIVDAFFASLATAPMDLDVCGGDPTAIDNPAPPADVDVSDGTPSCMKVHLYCLGKADDPWTGEPATAPTPTESTGGCAVAYGRTAGAVPAGLLALLALALVARPRRR
jgi:hypothetical protein